nr:MAG TPA: hypothetical protein [Caudoviricetes sp.]
MCRSSSICFSFRVARVGGNSNNGTNDGLWYWNLNNDSSNANWNCGARVFIFENNNLLLHIIFHSPC